MIVSKIIVIGKRDTVFNTIAQLYTIRQHARRLLIVLGRIIHAQYSASVQIMRALNKVIATYMVLDVRLPQNQ